MLRAALQGTFNIRGGGIRPSKYLPPSPFL
jgi:hypothetical protein